MLKHNYVFFDEPGSYYRIARYDLNHLDGCVIRENGILPDSSNIETLLFKIHTNQKLSAKGILLPFRMIWNRKIIGKICFQEKKPICFIFAMSGLRRYFDTDLIDFIRRTYPDSKIVLLRRDVIEKALREIKVNKVEDITHTFDRIYSINSYDVHQYGLTPINVMCSRYPVQENNSIPDSDAIFVGKTKDREEAVNKIYCKLTEAGLKCDFTLLIDGNEKNIHPGIRTIRSSMPYEEMLQRTIKSKCIIEITQQNIDSFSSRYLEALCYNKRLITDVKAVTSSKYYDPKNMFVIEKPEDVNPEFIKSKEPVNYHYDDFYSPINMIKSIDIDLSKE